MRLPHPLLALLAAGLFTGGAAAETCYTVVDRGNRTVYQSQDTPLDLAYQVGDTLYSRFPAALVMVIWNARGDCTELRDASLRTASVRVVGRVDRN